MEPNPKDKDCELGGEVARQWKADVIVAVGGGSVIDSAKVISLIQTHTGCIQDYEGRNRVTGKVTPIVAIPTTAGTGSEITHSTVNGLSDKESAELLVEELKILAKDIRIPSFHSLPYVKPSDFPQLAAVARSNGSTPRNCREINQEDYLNLFDRNYEE